MGRAEVEVRGAGADLEIGKWHADCMKARAQRGLRGETWGAENARRNSGLGLVLTGGATDVNSGPLLALSALACWPRPVRRSFTRVKVLPSAARVGEVRGASVAGSTNLSDTTAAPPPPMN